MHSTNEYLHKLHILAVTHRRGDGDGGGLPSERLLRNARALANIDFPLPVCIRSPRHDVIAAAHFFGPSWRAGGVVKPGNLFVCIITTPFCRYSEYASLLFSIIMKTCSNFQRSCRDFSCHFIKAFKVYD